MEVKKAKEVHADVRVPAAPHVHQHDGESLAQEKQAGKESKQLGTTESRKSPPTPCTTSRQHRVLWDRKPKPEAADHSVLRHRPCHRAFPG